MRTPRTLIVLILLGATALRFYRIDQQSFWNDEGNSARIAERVTSKIIAGAAGDIHPPGYYLALAGWRAAVGQSEFALRGLSALAGIVLVALVYRLGCAFDTAVAALSAATIAGLHPFLIYYAQEARMYSLAAMLAAATFLVMSRWLQIGTYRPAITGKPRASRTTVPVARGRGSLALGLVIAAGLYTHYSFAFVVLAANLVALVTLVRRRASPWRWLLPQLAALALFLPWLPTATRQVSTWPAGRGYLPWSNALVETWRWLTYGPTIETATVASGLVAFAALSLAGLLGKDGLPALLWLLVPTGLTLALGLFTEAFAKFLLIAVPAVCLLAGRGIAVGWRAYRRSRLGRDVPSALFYLLSLGALLVTWFRFVPSVLTNLYASPAYFRDDYRALARDIQTAERMGDAILLNAPNQWEVFTYYYPDGPHLYPLARTRPLDTAAQIAELESIVARHDRLFVLYWGDAQSDPGRVIESWLSEHTFKAYDRWYGNVRLAVYAVPAMALEVQTPIEAQFGEAIMLDGYALNANAFSPGEILQLTLFWHARAPIAGRYKIFVHLVGDSAAPPVAQQDGEPGGGLALTSTWTPAETVVDNHGVFLPLDLPAGQYRLAIGMYGVADGARLPVALEGQLVGDSLTLVDVLIR